MATTPSGTINLVDVRNVLNVTNSAAVPATTNYPTDFISFNDPVVRKLAGKPVAASSISMNEMRNKIGPIPYGIAYDAGACGVPGQLASTFTQTFNNGTYGTYPVHTTNSPSCRVTLTTGDANITSNKADYVINVNLLPGYIAGKSDIIITVQPGIYVYATLTTNAGLTILGGQAGDNITIINYGFIMGKGGRGGGGAGYWWTAENGGPAISLGWHATIDNTSAGAYIGGGGGGGGSNTSGRVGAGGGGAGGGNGGLSSTPNTQIAGVGGEPGQSGTDTTGTTPVSKGGGAGGGGGIAYTERIITYSFLSASSGGGGGRIFPGVGGVSTHGTNTLSTAGGSANNPGQSTNPSAHGGGGGGWGASGGPVGSTSVATVGAGGKAVQLNGNGVTWVNGNTTRVWGAVS